MNACQFVAINFVRSVILRVIEPIAKKCRVGHHYARVAMLPEAELIGKVNAGNKVWGSKTLAGELGRIAKCTDTRVN